MHEKDEDWLGQQLKDSAPDADLKVCTDSDQCPTYHMYSFPLWIDIHLLTYVYS